MSDKVNVEKIVSDACAHAQIELVKRLNARMEPQNRKSDIWMEDWMNEAETAIPAAISIALTRSITDVLKDLGLLETL